MTASYGPTDPNNVIDTRRHARRIRVAAIAAAAVLSWVSAWAEPGRMLVNGRVIDTTGSALPGASVVLRGDSGGHERATTTDGQGRFRFEGVPAGPFSITASLPGFSIARREVEAPRDTETVDLTLAPGAFEEEITVMGARLVGSEEVLRRTPGSVDILTSDALQSSFVFTTNEALRKVPGLHLRDEEGLGLRPNIGIRGLNPTRSAKALLLEDGVPTTYAPYGDNASYYHPPIERFSRVEILKGSGQIAHGPVTIGGVVNYITPDPPERPTAGVTVEGGSRDFLSGHVSFGGTWNGTGLLVDLMHKESDGARENQHSDLDDVTVKISRRLTPRQNLSFKGNYYGEDSRIGYSGLTSDEYRQNPRQNPFVNDNFYGDRGGLSAAYRALIGDRVALTTTAYGQVFRRHWWRQSSNSNQRPNDAGDPACGGMLNLSTTCGNEGRLRRYYLAGVEPRVRVSHALFGVAQETDFGVRFHTEDQERRQENGATPTAREGIVVENNHRTADAVASFVQHRFMAGAWTITPGVRFEHVRFARANRLAADGAGVSGRTTVSEVVPGMGVAYAAGRETTLFAGLHRGFAPPRVEDVISNAGGVVELDPERSWNAEVGARTRVVEGLRVDGTLFQMDYENQIVPASLAGGVGATLTNGGETLHRGLEVGAQFDTLTLTEGAHSVYARVALTWIPVARFTGVRVSGVPGFGATSVSGNRLPYAPETLSTTTFGYRHEAGLGLQIEAQHHGDQFSDDLNTVDETPDGQRGLISSLTLWNASASWRVRGLRTAFFVAVKNLTDRTAIVDRTRGIIPTYPRLIQVGTSWRF